MKYYIEDLQGGNFCEWTQEKPVTLKELRDIFMEYADMDEMEIKRKNLTLHFISDLWEVAVHKVAD